ncbi:hypothetical protein [Tunicatimonas pelagia]|uniref:hypothetical protein n=1 Tax=Tunicatimonas pelagia TaxID=931531 RepID=UPI0026652E0E|nr:hypothetical protein [Tunicatimonas pelagia]WKN45099.1 hypothetical protein P0M28_09000 [Tunicatimonas pelagia]
MASPKPTLIAAIRSTAKKLARSPQYQWGHMGSCNCGHLVQEVTQLSRADIHEYAMRTRGGDWSEQALDFCPTSGYLMDQVISIMLDAGMELADFKHLEQLSDKQVLARLPETSRHLRHNYREDVVIYMNAWADLLEEQLLQQVELPSLEVASAVSVG